MRAVSLHGDLVVVSSLIWQTNCVVLRGSAGDELPEEVFVIDSPILPEELMLLPGLLEQVGMAAVSALLVTHADWDHMLGRLAFPEADIGAAQSTLERLSSSMGEAQRELRDFDEEHYLERPRPLGLGSPQALPVPGRCEIGARELELHPAEGHTADGMAVVVPWAGVLVAGDYCSSIEIPVLGQGSSLQEYLATIARLRGLVGRDLQVVPGHGPVLEPEDALRILDEDEAYLRALADRGSAAELPASRQGRAQRRIHEANLSRL